MTATHVREVSSQGHSLARIRAVLLFVLCCLPAQAAIIEFKGVDEYVADLRRQALVAENAQAQVARGDLNADGVPDLAVLVSSTSSTVKGDVVRLDKHGLIAVLLARPGGGYILDFQGTPFQPPSLSSNSIAVDQGTLLVRDESQRQSDMSHTHTQQFLRDGGRWTLIGVRIHIVREGTSNSVDAGIDFTSGEMYAKDARGYRRRGRTRAVHCTLADYRRCSFTPKGHERLLDMIPRLVPDYLR